MLLSKKIYETRQVKHPTLKDRSITLLYINNKLDRAAFGFLVNEARNGGQKESASGQKTHIGRAYKIIELYRELDLQNITWKEAEENHIQIIRNRMLCWDMNDKMDYKYYDHTPIENDTMNQKLSVWLKFFKYQKKMNQYTRMVTNTELVKQWLPDAFLQHTSGEEHNQRYRMVERWRLMVKPSPRKLYHPALSELEFAAFRSQLRSIDIVYENIALLMVKTGLRIAAALDFQHSSLALWLRHINNGKTMQDTIPFKYTNKGGQTKQSEIPIETIYEIQANYRASKYRPRLAYYQNEWKGDDEPLWLRKDGKSITYRDVQTSFMQASHSMGRFINNITPHHMRHTFATWIILDSAKKNNIPLGIIGAEPHPILLAELMGRMGQVSTMSTIRYTMSAYKLLPKEEKKYGDRVLLTTLAIHQYKAIQRLLLEKAIEEYADDFCDKKFDLSKFAVKQGFAVEVN